MKVASLSFVSLKMKVIVWSLMGLMSGCSAQPNDRPVVNPTRTNPPYPAEYGAVAQHLAKESQWEGTPPQPESDLPQLLAELRTAQFELQAISSPDEHLNAIAHEAAANCQQLHAQLVKVQSLPPLPQAAEQMTENFIRGFVGDFIRVLDSIQSSKDLYEEHLRTRQQCLQTIQRIVAGQRQLPVIARKYAGPAVTQGQVLLVDYDAAWGPYGPHSTLRLTNHHTQDLHHCTVLVELHSPQGGTRNVHFQPHWPAGATLQTQYSPGIEGNNGLILRETFADIEQLIVSVWAEELSQERITYSYQGPEHEADIARYCQALKWTASYQPYVSGYLWDTNRGLHLTMTGLNHLPALQVAVTFVRGEQTQRLVWNYESWKQGETKFLDPKGQLRWDPQRAEITVQFPGCDYQHKSTFTFAK